MPVFGVLGTIDAGCSVVRKKWPRCQGAKSLAHQ